MPNPMQRSGSTESNPSQTSSPIWPQAHGPTTIPTENATTQEALFAGTPLQFYMCVNSLEPVVACGETRVFSSIIPGGNSHIQAGDIVFCRVHPHARYVCHLVWRAFKWPNERGNDEKCYVLGSNKMDSAKQCNGWCSHKDIYGIPVKTTPGEINTAKRGRRDDEDGDKSPAESAKPTA